MITRGFVTIATGSEKYYELAAMLLRSYRKLADSSVPFAIICDSQNTYTSGFDDVIILESAQRSYMDKLLLYKYAPYDENIFIDADSLIVSDPADIWEDFQAADDVSCYGCTYPEDSDRGWFRKDGCGKYTDDIHYVIDLHGGIYYFRKTRRCRDIFEKAMELSQEYSKYSFSSFSNPADEPVLALSLAIHGSHPCDRNAKIVFIPSYRGKLSVDLEGNLFISGKKSSVPIVHFATANTKRFIYRYMSACIDGKAGLLTYIRLFAQTFPIALKAESRHFAGMILRRFLPSHIVDELKRKL